MTGRPLILIVDDEPGVRASVRVILERECEVLDAVDGPDALEVVRARDVDLCLLDVRLPGMDGLSVLERIRRDDGAPEVVLVSAVGTFKTAVEAIKLGAYDYLAKPFTVAELREVVQRALERRALRQELRHRREPRGHEVDGQLVGRSPAIRQLHQLIVRVASHRATVLLTGESGTGKELIARAIHRRGPRRTGPFVAVNCGALPTELMESELFGHERGAFTGAHARKLGKFEIAAGGTLFLDEVGTLRVDLQPKLLRAIQEREIERLGGRGGLKVDVRFIAATNVDLQRAVADQRFREDLFYRLNVIHIVVPPLRDRPEDVAPLAHHFLAKYARQFGKETAAISPGALELLERYHWPGNVRELENAIERSVALATDGAVELEAVPLEPALTPSPMSAADRLNFRAARQEFERQLVRRALDRAGGNRTRAARLLGMHRNTLGTKLGRDQRRNIS